MGKKDGPRRALDVTNNERQAVTAAARLFAVQPTGTSRDALVAAVDAIRDADERDGRPLRDAPSEEERRAGLRRRRDKSQAPPSRRGGKGIQSEASTSAAAELADKANADREAAEAAERERIAAAQK